MKLNVKIIGCLMLFLLVGIYCSPLKKVLNRKDIKFLNKIVDSMYTVDQDIRNAIWDIDSIYKVDKKSNNGQYQLNFMKKKKLGERYNQYKKSVDSVYNEMRKIDDSNTNKLLQLTKKYGFPSQERLKAKRASAYLLFVHSPRSYFDEIKALLSSEYKANRISEYEKAYIFWHINDRIGFPPKLAKNGRVIYNKK
ncbi:hypothetical protein [Pseudotenacibaculum haliotis]|uniref:Lipoprotein n=1 Tax=Pseudotenacibaculum haliotis TaxID=1862138 RepID=A0ABW5LZQ8_9FLAO